MKLVFHSFLHFLGHLSGSGSWGSGEFPSEHQASSLPQDWYRPIHTYRPVAVVSKTYREMLCRVLLHIATTHTHSLSIHTETMQTVSFSSTLNLKLPNCPAAVSQTTALGPNWVTGLLLEGLNSPQRLLSHTWKQVPRRKHYIMCFRADDHKATVYFSNQGRGLNRCYHVALWEMYEAVFDQKFSLLRPCESPTFFGHAILICSCNSLIFFLILGPANATGFTWYLNDTPQPDYSVMADHRHSTYIGLTVGFPLKIYIWYSILC